MFYSLPPLFFEERERECKWEVGVRGERRVSGRES